MKNVVSHTLSVRKKHELLRKLEIAGLTGTLAQKVIKDNKFATKVVEFIQNDDKPTKKHKRILKRDPKRDRKLARKITRKRH